MSKSEEKTLMYYLIELKYVKITLFSFRMYNRHYNYYLLKIDHAKQNIDIKGINLDIIITSTRVGVQNQRWGRFIWPSAYFRLPLQGGLGL